MASDSDPDSRLSPSASAGQPASQLPSAVRYARGLLWLQGAIWGYLAIGSAVATVVTMIHVLANHQSWSHIAATVGLFPVAAALTGCFAVAKFRLAWRLKGAHARSRKTVIGVEIAMTCLGVLMTAGLNPSGGMPADMVGLAAFTGGALSLVAAFGLMRRPARNYFANTGRKADLAAEGNRGNGTRYSGVRQGSAAVCRGASVSACHA